MLSLRALASLAVAAVAAPATVQNGTGFVWIPSSLDQSTCGPSTFDQASIGDAANWRHCAALSSSWSSENGHFSIYDVSGDGYIPILKTKDCTLGVKAMDLDQGSYTVGDMDVKAILKAALLDYSEGTDLAVQGDVKCNVASGGRADLHWQIYGSGF